MQTKSTLDRKISLAVHTWGIIVLVVSFHQLQAQTFDPKRYDSARMHAEIRVGVRYTSDFYYMGRSDSAAAPYLSPSIGYFHGSGFFVRSSLSYLPSASRVDLIVLNGGYDYYDKKYVAGASVSEYIFSDRSYTVLSEMSTYLMAMQVMTFLASCFTWM